jgi:hypothetical protein
MRIPRTEADSLSPLARRPGGDPIWRGQRCSASSVAVLGRRERAGYQLTEGHSLLESYSQLCGAKFAAPHGTTRGRVVARMSVEWWYYTKSALATVNRIFSSNSHFFKCSLPPEVWLRREETPCEPHSNTSASAPTSRRSMATTPIGRIPVMNAAPMNPAARLSNRAVCLPPPPSGKRAERHQRSSDAALHGRQRLARTWAKVSSRQCGVQPLHSTPRKAPPRHPLQPRSRHP